LEGRNSSLYPFLYFYSLFTEHCASITLNTKSIENVVINTFLDSIVLQREKKKDRKILKNLYQLGERKKEKLCLDLHKIFLFF
jgi:hypothetical protein